MNDAQAIVLDFGTHYYVANFKKGDKCYNDQLFTLIRGILFAEHDSVGQFCYDRYMRGYIILFSFGEFTHNQKNCIYRSVKSIYWQRLTKTVISYPKKFKKDASFVSVPKPIEDIILTKIRFEIDHRYRFEAVDRQGKRYSCFADKYYATQYGLEDDSELSNAVLECFRNLTNGTYTQYSDIPKYITSVEISYSLNDPLYGDDSNGIVVPYTSSE